MSRKRGRAGQPPRTPPSVPRSAPEPTPVARPGWRTRVRRRLYEFFDKWALAALIVGIVLFIVLIGISPQAISLLHQETITDTVVKSERVTSGESSKYLVFGKREVYQNTDAIVVWKLNSSDFYRDIQAGKTYRFKVIGWRIPFFSLYRNIIHFEEVAAE